MRLRKAPEGRYKAMGVLEVPALAAGAGSVVGARFKLKRGYLKARCFDGRLQFVLALGFRQRVCEQKLAGSALSDQGGP